MVQKEQVQSPTQIYTSDRSLATSFQIAHSLKAIKIYVKLNVDAVHAILKYDIGDFIAAANEKLDVCVDAFMTEFMAL